MKDKELQELFVAKRTVEANRRRQEELRRMMEAESGKRNVESSRRLWPVWFGAAAAAVLLLLIALPTLFHRPESTPLMVAQIDSLPPIPIKDTMPEERVSRPLPGRGGQRPGGVKKEQQQELAVATDEDTHPYPSQEGTADAVTIHPVQVADQPFAMAIDEPTVNTPRIHRRTSTSMVCSNCRINNVPSPSTVLQDFLAATFGTESNTPYTLKNIEF